MKMEMDRWTDVQLLSVFRDQAPRELGKGQGTKELLTADEAIQVTFCTLHPTRSSRPCESTSQERAGVQRERDDTNRMRQFGSILPDT